MIKNLRLNRQYADFENQNSPSQIERRKAMILIRKVFPIILMAAFMFPVFLTDAGAQDSVRQGEKSLCKIGDVMRRVEVHYYAEDKPVPCEVHYYKDTEEPGEDKVLWRAENEVGFCENKLTAFVGDLTGFGWYCESEGDIPPSLQLDETN
jgi:hypothetical protein